MTAVTPDDVRAIAAGYDPDPARSMSLRADAYIGPQWFDLEQRSVFGRTWQWICHVEKVRRPGSYVAATVAGMPIAVVRDRSGLLRAFYNVCKHRAHELLSGSGSVRSIVCPPDLAAQIHARAPDVADLTFAKRLTYDVRSNWKNVIDNFLECYHCHIAHKEFVELVDMRTYEVTTHGIWSSHFAEAGNRVNSAYDVSAASVTEHAVWWLWPNTCLLRYPGRGNFMVFQVIPAGPGRTLETWDFFFETDELQPGEIEAVSYIDDVLQVQDIALVESVQRGMATPAFDQGRIIYDPADPGLSEHGVHHFHGLLLKAYRDIVGSGVHV